MQITAAKRALYQQLKGEAGITGAGIREKNGAGVIVIYLTRPKKTITAKIPTSFKGIKVITEQRSVAKAV